MAGNIFMNLKNIEIGKFEKGYFKMFEKKIKKI